MAIKKWNIAALRARAGTSFTPQTGVEANQGDLYRVFPGVGRETRTPMNPGVNLVGWVNPYSLSFYQVALNTSNAVQAAPPNLRRAYLLVQNQGPGNVFLNFGQGATLPTSNLNANCMQLITTQFYEQIGGGSIDLDSGYPIAGNFVSPDYISAITDTAATTLLVGEGVFMISRWAGLGADTRG